MSRESRLDEFRRVTGATMRAIAHKVELNVNFAPGQPGFTGSEARLPLPARDLPPEDVAQTRGAADSIALRLRHHDSKLHARETPKNEAAREVFEAIEHARVEAIGALQMKGVADNLTASLDEHCRQRGFNRLTEREHAPLGEALRLLAREAMTGLAPPASAKRLVELWRPEIGDAARADLAGLAGVMNDQRAYAKAVRRLISDLDLDPGAEDLEADDSEDQDDNDSKQDDPNEAKGEGGEKDSADSAEMEGSEGESGQEESGETDSAETDMEMKGEGGEDSPNRPGRPPESDPRKRGQNEPSYRPFTEEFDETVEAADLCDPDELARLRQLLDQQLDASADGGRPARQPAAAPAAGQAEPELGIRPRGGDARRGPPAAGRGQPRDAALLQARARYRIPRHGGDAADRQFRLDARAADHGRRHERRHPGAHAGALRRQGRGAGLHHPDVEGRPVARALDRRRQARQSRAAQRSAPYHLQIRRRPLAPRPQEPGPDAARGNS